MTLPHQILDTEPRGAFGGASGSACIGNRISFYDVFSLQQNKFIYFFGERSLFVTHGLMHLLDPNSSVPNELKHAFGTVAFE